MNNIVISQFGKLKLDKYGNWYHNGIPFVHEGIINFFYKNIHKFENGAFIVQQDGKKVPVETDDVILWVTEINWDKKNNKVSFILSNDDVEEITPKTSLFYDHENEIYFISSKNEKVRFNHKANVQISRYIKEEGFKYYLVIDNLEILINPE